MPRKFTVFVMAVAERSISRLFSLDHIAPDGRFLMIRWGSAATDNATASQNLVLVLNWFEELKCLVPIP